MVRRDDWGHGNNCTLFLFDNAANGCLNSPVLMMMMLYFVRYKQILGDIKTNLAIEMSQNNTLTNGKL